MSLHEVLAAASRARALATDLERSDRPVDRNQVAAGVRHELDTILRLVRVELERLEAAATQDHPGKVRADAPGTSRAAAQAITLKTGTVRFQILEHLWLAGSVDTGIARWNGGMTDWELQHALNLNPSTERPRRGELADAHLIRPIGTRTHNGSVWTVWGLTQAGADAYRKRVPGPPRVVTHAGDPSLF
jgi:hypothetical protein